MTIDPYILLGLGSMFALIYALVIIIGWARTRHNRHIVHSAKGLSVVPTLQLDPTVTDAPREVSTFSLTTNRFTDRDGNPLNPADFNVYIAVVESEKYPTVKSGNLIFLDADGNLKYRFDIPTLESYR